MIGHGPHGRSAFHKAVVGVSQKGNIKTAAGELYTACPEAIVSNRTFDALADRFKEFFYDVPGTDQTLRYQLYLPEDYNPAEKYPLVLFIHDAGSCADEAIAPLAQGNGAVVWASEEEQKKHKCFVLAPCYPTVCANDDFQVTEEAEYTVALVKEIAKKYPIDEKRIYGTGQSMGCMMLCEMNIRYPEMFGGCLLVAGQWNPETMVSCKDKNFWIIVSQGDKKAYPIMGACMENIEKAGGKVTRGAINAKASNEELRFEIEALEQNGNHINFTWFEGESIIPDGVTESHPGMHHVLTWTRAYDITALRDWLFRQTL
jgi:predicted peptidase